MRGTTIVMAVLLASSVASAQPVKPVGKLPTKAVPCAMGDPQLHAVGEDPVLCWDAGCMQLDLDKSTASLVEKPPVASAWLGPTAEVKGDSACVGTTCKKLGKNLVVALADARQETAPQYVPRILATADLKTVVVGPTAWNVQADRRIKLAAPVGVKPALGKNNNKAFEVSYIDVAGDLLLVHWSNCVDDLCLRVVLTDGAGRAIGAHRSGGGLAPIQLDPETGFVIVSELGSVQFYGMESRKLEGSLELSVRPWAAVRIDKHTVGLLYETFSDRNTLHITKIVWYEPGAWVPAGTAARTSMALPRCTQ